MKFEVFKDSGAQTIAVRVGREVAVMSIGDWSKAIARPKSASEMFIGSDTAPSEYCAPMKDPA